MAKRQRVNPELRKKVIERRAKHAQAIIDLKARRKVLVADLKSARAREAKLRTTEARLQQRLIRKEADLAVVHLQIDRAKLRTEAIQGDISAQKLRGAKPAQAQLILLERSKKEGPQLRKQVRPLENEIADTKLDIKMTRENLSEVRRELSGIFRDGDRLNKAERKLMGR